MPVTVAVISWNTRDLLRHCLHSLAREAEAGRAQVWVVDNASQDGSAEMVATAFPWVQLIASEENLGFGAGVNLVAQHAPASDWIAPANADIALLPGALETLVRAGEADPRSAIVAPRLILPDASTQHSVHPFPGLASTLAVNLSPAGLSPALGRRLTLDDHWDRSIPRRVDWAHGAFLLIRRRAFEAVGGFDTHQFLYAEDLDIAWRLARAGWHTRYEPGARVQHAHSAAITQLYGDERDLKAQRSAYAWMLRRRGPLLMRACALINTLGAALRAVAATPRAILPGGDAGLAAWRLRRHTRVHLDGLTASRRRLEQHR